MEGDEDGKISWRDMKTKQAVQHMHGTGKKKSYACDLEKEKKSVKIILRGGSLLGEVLVGQVIGKNQGVQNN